VGSATMIVVRPQRMPRLQPALMRVHRAPHPRGKPDIRLQLAIASAIARSGKKSVAAPHEPSCAIVSAVEGAPLALGPAGTIARESARAGDAPKMKNAIASATRNCMTLTRP